MIVDTDTRKEINKLIALRDESISQAKAYCVERVTPMLSTLFEGIRKPNLTHIFVLGYTPAWNDGEECEHNTVAYVSNKSSYPDILEYFERFDDELDWDNPDPKYALINSNLTHETAKDIGRKFVTEYQYLLEEVFGTNWRLEITFTDDGILLKHDEYDCGY